MPSPRVSHNTLASVLSPKATLWAFLLALAVLPAFPQGDWTQLPPMIKGGRDLARAVVVSNRLYVIGGHDANRELNTVEFYNPATNTWSAPSHPMPTPRHQTAVGAIKGIIYVAGGCCPAWSALEAYDPEQDTWTKKAPMPVATEAAGVVLNASLYAVGGNAGGHCSSKVQIYEPLTDKWTLAPEMPTPRCHLAVVVLDGLLYAIGGSDTTGRVLYPTVEVYNPSTMHWSELSPMQTGRSLLTAVAVRNKIYVLGGNDKDGHSLNTVEIYNPSTNTWREGGEMPEARTGLTAGAIRDAIYVVGGYAKDQFQSAGWRFTP